MKKLKLFIWAALIFATGVILFSVPAIANPPATILIFPFAIHAADDQAFMRQAVMDMVYTRLSGEGWTIVLESVPPPAGQTASPLTDMAAARIGRDKQADYILVGSLTVLGESVSTDARLIRSADQTPVLVFNQSGQGQGAVIQHVDALASRINQDVFPAAKPTSPTDSAPAADAKPLPVPPASAAASGEALSYWKSDNFKTEITSLAIGDVDGDGQNETVFTDRHTVYIYRFRDKGLEPVDTIAARSYNQYIRVDVADIHRDGKAEIFVTNTIPSQNRVQSFVLEWNGAAFERRVEKAEWYYRVVLDSSQKPKLLGQKRGPGTSVFSIREALFEKEVFELQWQDGQYVPAAAVNLPKGLAIYDYIAGDIANQGIQNIVAFSDSDYLKVLNLDGDEEWISDEPYGGSPVYFEAPNPSDHGLTERYYLPQRIHVTDFDRDGSNEILVVKNRDVARALAQTRILKEGVIECLSYDAIGAQLKWQTRSISGYISDYTIGDYDNDGRNDLVFVSVTKRKSIASKGLSGIVALSLGKR